MTSSNHISVVFTREGDSCAWIALDERRGTWSAETMVRVRGGIRYREREYGTTCPTLDCLRRDALMGGFYSQRPFDPSVPGDPSMIDCALALFSNFCDNRGIDAGALLREQPNAYRQNWDLKQILEQAEWEGTDYPAVWNAQWVEALASLLDAVCCEYLADLVAGVK